MFQQLRNINATAEHCFRMIKRRHFGLVEINKYGCTCSLGHRTVLLTRKTCMCNHSDFCIVPNTKHDHDAMSMLCSLIMQASSRFPVSHTQWYASPENTHVNRVKNMQHHI